MISFEDTIGAGMKLDFGWRKYGYYYTYSRWTLATTSGFTNYLGVEDSTLGSTSLLSLMSKMADMGNSKINPNFCVHKEKWGQATKIKA